MNEQDQIQFWELLLISVFITIPLLRIHAAYVLFRTRNMIKKIPRIDGVATGIGVATDRLIVAVTGAIGAVLLALAGLNRLFAVVPDLNTLFIVGALIMFAVPAVVWEYMYVTGELEK